MRQLSDADVMRAWERGLVVSPSRRAITLLAIACDQSADALGTLTPGERDARLLTARRRTFGDAMECVAPCPGCGERLEFTLDAAVLLPDGASYAADTQPATVAAAGYRAIVRAPTFALARATRVVRCALGAQRLRDSRRTVTTTPSMLTELPAALVDAIDTRLAAADPAAITELAMRCPACDHDWSQLFDIVGFFWAELAARAERLLGEVHALARAYGWSEAAILGNGLGAPRAVSGARCRVTSYLATLAARELGNDRPARSPAPDGHPGAVLPPAHSGGSSHGRRPAPESADRDTLPQELADEDPLARSVGRDRRRSARGRRAARRARSGRASADTPWSR
jgi:hypothetical protein